jgi:4-amino-4-deoxy-L-arabinose transferase-like glycosyltransferase
MTGGRGAIAAAILVAAAIGVLYFWRLGDAPVYLAHDEVIFGVEANAIAQTLHDTTGKFLPLYIKLGKNYWCSPVHIYAAAALLRFVHVSDTSIRVPTVIVGLLAVVLMYFAGRDLFRNRWVGLLTASFLALSPAHFIASRFKVESHYPLPFIAAWIVCLVRFQQTRRSGWLAAAGAALGLGIYTYHASPIMMSVYLVMTIAMVAALSPSFRDAVRASAPAVAVFVLVALPFALFVLRHPELVRDQAGSYGVYDTSRLSLAQGVSEVVSWPGLTARANLYYDYFNPSFLFFSGGSSIIEATQRAGVFLWPFAIFLCAGLYRLIGKERTPFGWLLIAGFFTAPLAAAVIIESYATRRILPMVPFAAVIAIYGVKELIESSRWLVRYGAVVLLAAVPVCFAYFYADYMGDYRRRSAYWFEDNIRGALESTIAHAPPGAAAPPIRISRSLNDYVEWDWKFYTAKHDRTDLERLTQFFDPKAASPSQLPPGAIVVAEIAAADDVVKLAGGRLTQLADIREPTGNVTFRVWAKDAATE